MREASTFQNRWFRFGLAALLLLVTWIAAFLGAMKAGYNYGFRAGQAQLAAQTFLTRTYACDDLLAAPTPSRFTQQARLIDLITNTVEPASWQKTGGPGRIDVLQGPPPMLVIAHTEDSHQQIAALLAHLRNGPARTP